MESKAGVKVIEINLVQPRMVYYHRGLLSNRITEAFMAPCKWFPGLIGLKQVSITVKQGMGGLGDRARKVSTWEYEPDRNNL